jgi:hypothetical protein
MPSTRTFIRSWHGGVISPQMTGRIDANQYQAGAEDIDNWAVLPTGVLRRRPGLEDMGAAKGTKVALIEFDAGPGDAYVVELGNLYARFWRNGERIVVVGRAFQASGPATVIVGTTVTQNTPAHTHLEGDIVRWTTTGTLPAPLVAGTNYYVRNVVAGTTYELSLTPTGPIISFTSVGAPTNTVHRVYQLGAVVRQSSVDYYCLVQNASTPPPSLGVWYPLADAGGGSSIYEIQTPYTPAQLLDLNHDQVNDITTIAHVDQQPRELRRYDDTFWTLVAMQAEASLLAPSGLAAKIVRGTREPCTSITIANPAVLTFAAAHRFGVNDGVYVSGFTFTPATTVLKDGFYQVNYIPITTTLQLRTYDNTVVSTLGLVSSTTGTLQYWPREAEATAEYVITTISPDGSESEPSATLSVFNRLDAEGARNILTWDDVAGALRFILYRRRDGIFAYLGEVDGKTAAPSSTVAFTLSAAGSTVNWTAHPLKDGQPFRLTPALGGSLPTATSAGNLLSTTTYYVRNTGTNSFYFALDPDGAIITGGVAGVGTSTASGRRWFQDDAITPEGRTPPLRDDDDLVTVGNYPGAVGHYQQRRFFAGSTNDPQRFLASNSSTESAFSYHLPALSTDRLDWDVAVRRRAEIRHLIPLQDLLALTSSSEVRIRPVGSDVLGPSTIDSAAQTHVGCSRVRPLLSQASVLFVSDREQHIVALGYAVTAQGYLVDDTSLRASHLFDGYDILDSAQLKAPYPIDLWLRSDGVILACTSVPSEQVTAWWTITTDGTVEAIAVERDGRQDRLVAAVRREVDGVEVLRLERLSEWTSVLEDWVGSDAGIVVAPAGSAVINDLGHLEGLQVQVVADGRVHPPRTVTGGQIVLQSDTYERVVIGRGYTSRVETLPLSLQFEAYAQGRTMNVIDATLRVVETSANMEVGAITGAARLLWPQGPGAQRTEDARLTVPGLWQKGGRIYIEADDPLPATLVAMTLHVAIGD